MQSSRCHSLKLLCTLSRKSFRAERTPAQLRNQLRYSSTNAGSVPAQLQAALRPFIFSVHPDLFGQFPLHKETNETSLKALNEYIQHKDSYGVQSARKDVVLKFYQRVDNPTNNSKSELKLIKVRLTQNVAQSIKTLLEDSGMSTSAVSDIIKSELEEDGREKQPPDRPIDWIQANYFAATGKQYPFVDVWEELTRLKPAVTLHRWLKSNIENARRLEEESKPLRHDYLNLKRNIELDFGLLGISWTCGWRGTHQLASLKSLQKLLETEAIHNSVVKGRKIVFGTESGVSLKGDVVLCSEEVPQQWSKALSLVPSSDKYLQKIPIAEQQLSSLLKDIQIKQRTSSPIPMAGAYYSWLAMLISRFGMAYDMSGSRLSSLSHLQMSVSGFMGDELTLTPEGQINVPSHSPVWAINNFIRDNESTAVELKVKHTSNREEATKLIQQVKEKYSLDALRIDDSISYDQVIQCCKNLLISSDSIRYSLRDIRLCIAPFFSVMNDGEMYILWNWINDT